MSPHYLGLYAAYATAALGWWLVLVLTRRLRMAPSTWDVGIEPRFAHPWREFGFAMIAVVAILAIGHVWVMGWLPRASGAARPFVEALNQIIIFLPIVLVPVLRRQSPRTMLLPGDRIHVRVLTGMLLALAALAVYSVVRSGSYGPGEMLVRILQLENVDEAVQVLMEDIAIGVVAYRLAAAVGARWTVVIVSLLFALGHVPALIATGASARELASLALDFGLGLMLVGTVLRSGDVLWFWPIHTVMDLTQFTRITGL